MRYDMSDPVPFGSGAFDLVVALRTIIDAAYKFDSLGREDLWIYFIYGRLHFSEHILQIPATFFVARLDCRYLHHSMHRTAREALYCSLAIVYITSLN